VTVPNQPQSFHKPRPARDRRAPFDDSVEWRDYPRISPGQYFAYCYWANRYRDRGFHRWTCLLRWDVLSDDLLITIAHCVPLWFHLGDKDKPHASRRGKYLREWVRASERPCMYHRQLRCFDCHDVHSNQNTASLRAPANALCLSCHAKDKDT